MACKPYWHNLPGACRMATPATLPRPNLWCNRCKPTSRNIFTPAQRKSSQALETCTWLISGSKTTSIPMGKEQQRFFLRRLKNIVEQRIDIMMHFGYTKYNRSASHENGQLYIFFESIILDKYTCRCIIVVTEPTTPLNFMRNSVGLFLFVRCLYVSISKTNIIIITANTILY